MTLKDFFFNVILPVLGENPDSAPSFHQQNVEGVSNLVFSECLPINNRIFLHLGIEPLLPRFYSFDDSLPFDERLLIDCCSYGVASRLIIDDSDTAASKIGFLEASYNQAKDKFDRAFVADVVRWVDYD